MVCIIIFSLLSVSLFIRKVQRPTKQQNRSLYTYKKDKKLNLEETKSKLNQSQKEFDRMYKAFVANDMNLEYLKSVNLNEAEKKTFALWLSDKLIAEGKHEVAKDILIEIGEYEKAVPVIISLAVYNKAQGNIEKAKELYALAVELYKRIGDQKKAEEIKKHINLL